MIEFVFLVLYVSVLDFFLFDILFDFLSSFLFVFDVCILVYIGV
jgi:hypothetical protein